MSSNGPLAIEVPFSNHDKYLFGDLSPICHEAPSSYNVRVLADTYTRIEETR